MTDVSSEGPGICRLLDFARNVHDVILLPTAQSKAHLVPSRVLQQSRQRVHAPSLRMCITGTFCYLLWAPNNPQQPKFLDPLGSASASGCLRIEQSMSCQLRVCTVAWKLLIQRFVAMNPMVSNASAPEPFM